MSESTAFVRQQPKATLRRPGILPRIVKDRSFEHYGIKTEEWTVHLKDDTTGIIAWARDAVDATIRDGEPNPAFEARFDRRDPEGEARARGMVRRAFELTNGADLDPEKPRDTGRYIPATEGLAEASL